MQNAFDILQERGFIEQTTHEREIKELFSKGRVTFYNGYDPTADSLHIGHFTNFMALSWLQKSGHRPIVLMGGGTGMVGDPDKADKMRPLMDIAQIDHNVECFKAQAAKFIDFSEGEAVIVNNADWLRQLKYADFIREYGVHFSVNRMLTADKYKTKFEGSGLTFFELNYMVMQAYDFLELNRRFDCVLQTGGNDQWSNIIAGVELIRRAERKSAYGMTFALLLAQGEKMGKTMGNAVWLDAAKMSPYDFYQHFRNVADSDVRQHLAMLTFLPMEQVNELSALKDSAVNQAKEILAFEVTKIVHGEEEAVKAQTAARALFAGGSDTENIPTTEIPRDKISDGINIIDLLDTLGLLPTRSEGRRLIQQGGIKVNDTKITTHEHKITEADFPDGYALVQKGKKIYHRAKLN